MSEKKCSAWGEELGIDGGSVREIVEALEEVITGTLYGDLDRNGTVKLLPKKASKELKILLANSIADFLPSWRESCVNNIVSPPKLLDFDWRVDIASSSNVLSRMLVPSVLVEMTLQDEATHHREMAGTRNVQFELSKEALGTLVKSLGKIRDQLANIS
eukprot:CAMPEP_0197518128 /NCGR_PEP_ID=MMETSP1318-20131121/3257_1 /TAXON_ID=552666 /ORGANISM="Partenskyella glossopodia, Strain RCC365" /LENGTH=158 /DNA_ID=CAMNT_0043068225 /DNA_START=38 /DNA_END=514 /DNA_ORIENTATION=+